MINEIARIGYNFDNSKVTWKTYELRSVPKSVCTKWLKMLTKNDLYLTQGINVQHKGINYTVYLERYLKSLYGNNYNCIGFEETPDALMYVHGEETA
jgi:hypothetical protein